MALRLDQALSEFLSNKITLSFRSSSLSLIGAFPESPISLLRILIGIIDKEIDGLPPDRGERFKESVQFEQLDQQFNCLLSVTYVLQKLELQVLESSVQSESSERRINSRAKSRGGSSVERSKLVESSPRTTPQSSSPARKELGASNATTEAYQLLFKAAIDWLERIFISSNEPLIFPVTQEFSLDPDMSTSCASFLSHLQLFISCVLAAICEVDLSAGTRLFRRAGGSESDSEGEQIIDSDSDQVPLNERLCTYRQTGKNHENQHWYHCYTCKYIEDKGVCSVCALVCHAGHDLSYAKEGNFYCDCGERETTSPGQCWAMRPRAPALPVAHRSVSGAVAGRSGSHESGRCSSLRAGGRDSSTCIDQFEADADKQSDACGAKEAAPAAAAKERKRHGQAGEQAAGRRKRTRHTQQSASADWLSKSRVAFFKRLQSTLAPRREQFLEFLSSRDLMKLGEELLQRVMREIRKSSVSPDALSVKSGRPRLLAALASLHRGLITKQLQLSIYQSKKDAPRSPESSALMMPVLSATPGSFEALKMNQLADQLSASVRQQVSGYSIHRRSLAVLVLGTAVECTESQARGQREVLVVQDKSNLLKLYALDGFLRRDFDEATVSETDTSLDRKDSAQAETSADRPKGEAPAVAAVPETSEVCTVDGKRTFGHSLTAIQLSFTCLYIAVNPADQSCLLVSGARELALVRLNSTAQKYELSMLPAPLDSSQFIVRTLWLPGAQDRFLVASSDHVYVMQLQCGRKHNVRAETVYDFQVPVGKVRDVTVVVVSDEGKATASPSASASASAATEGSQSQVPHVQAKFTLLIMSSNGHIYMQSLGETNTFALGGTFFATDTLELKHPEIKETDGVVTGGGLSIHYSHSLQLLFFSYFSSRTNSGKSFVKPMPGGLLSGPGASPPDAILQIQIEDPSVAAPSAAAATAPPSVPAAPKPPEQPTITHTLPPSSGPRRIIPRGGSPSSRPSDTARSSAAAATAGRAEMDDEDIVADFSNEDLLFADEVMMSLGFPLPPSPNDAARGSASAAAASAAAAGGATQGASGEGSVSAPAPSRTSGSLASALMRRLARVRPTPPSSGWDAASTAEPAPVGERRRSRERIMFELLHRADTLAPRPVEPKATTTRVVQSPVRGSFAVLEWIESTEHPGLMCALTTGFAAYSLAIDPERLSLQELKPIGLLASQPTASNKKVRAQDLALIRHLSTNGERTSLFVLNDDLSLDLLTSQSEQTDFWIRDRPQRKIKVSKRIIKVGDIDVFQYAKLTNEIEFSGREILHIYNSEELLSRLSTPNRPIAIEKPNGFSLEVTNKNPSNVVVGCRVNLHVGDEGSAFDKLPQYIEILGKRVNIVSLANTFGGHPSRFFDFPFSKEQIHTLANSNTFTIYFGPSHSAGAGATGASSAATGSVELVQVFVESRQMLDISGQQDEAVANFSSKAKQSERLARPVSGSPHGRRAVPRAGKGTLSATAAAAAESPSRRAHYGQGSVQAASETTLALMKVFSDAEQAGASLFLMGPAFHFSAAELTQLPPTQRSLVSVLCMLRAFISLLPAGALSSSPPPVVSFSPSKEHFRTPPSSVPTPCPLAFFDPTGAEPTGSTSGPDVRPSALEQQSSTPAASEQVSSTTRAHVRVRRATSLSFSPFDLQQLRTAISVLLNVPKHAYSSYTLASLHALLRSLFDKEFSFHECEEEILMRSVWQRLAQLISQINSGSPSSDEPSNALDLCDLVTVLEDLRSLARARPLKFGNQFLARAPLEESFMSVSATTPSPSSSINYNLKDGEAASSLLAGVSVELDIDWSAAVRGTAGASSSPSLPVALLYVFWSLVKTQPASAHVAPVTAIAFTQTDHASLSWIVRALTELLYTLALSDLSRVELVAKLLSSLLFAKSTDISSWCSSSLISLLLKQCDQDTTLNLSTLLQRMHGYNHTWMGDLTGHGAIGMLSEAAGGEVAAAAVSEPPGTQWPPLSQPGSTDLAENGETYVDTEGEGVGEEGEEEEGDEWGDAGELHDEEMRLAIFGGRAPLDSHDILNGRPVDFTEEPVSSGSGAVILHAESEGEASEEEEEEEEEEEMDEETSAQQQNAREDAPEMPPPAASDEQSTHLPVAQAQLAAVLEGPLPPPVVAEEDEEAMLQMAFALSLQEQQQQEQQQQQQRQATPPRPAAPPEPPASSGSLELQEPQSESVPPSPRGELNVREQPGARAPVAAAGSASRDERSSLAHVSAAVSESGASSQNISRASTPPPSQEPPSAATSSRPSESAQGQLTQTPRERPASFALSEAASLNVLNDIPGTNTETSASESEGEEEEAEQTGEAHSTTLTPAPSMSSLSPRPPIRSGSRKSLGSASGRVSVVSAQQGGAGGMGSTLTCGLRFADVEESRKAHAELLRRLLAAMAQTLPRVVGELDGPRVENFSRTLYLLIELCAKLPPDAAAPDAATSTLREVLTTIVDIILNRESLNGQPLSKQVPANELRLVLLPVILGPMMYKTGESGERSAERMGPKSTRELATQSSSTASVLSSAPAAESTAVSFASLSEPLIAGAPSAASGDQRLLVFHETLSALNREETFEFCYLALQDVLNYFKCQHPYLSSAAALADCVRKTSSDADAELPFALHLMETVLRLMVCVRKTWVSRTLSEERTGLFSQMSTANLDTGEELNENRDDAAADADESTTASSRSSSSDGLKEKTAAIFRERELCHSRDWVPLFCDILQYEKRVADYLKHQEQQLADLHAIKTNSKRLLSRVLGSSSASKRVRDLFQLRSIYTNLQNIIAQCQNAFEDMGWERAAYSDLQSDATFVEIAPVGSAADVSICSGHLITSKLEFGALSECMLCLKQLLARASRRPIHWQLFCLRASPGGVVPQNQLQPAPLEESPSEKCPLLFLLMLAPLVEDKFVETIFSLLSLALVGRDSVSAIKQLEQSKLLELDSGPTSASADEHAEAAKPQSQEKPSRAAHIKFHDVSDELAAAGERGKRRRGSERQHGKKDKRASAGGSKFDRALVPQLISLLFETIAGSGYLRRFLRAFLLRSPNPSLRSDAQAITFALFEQANDTQKWYLLEELLALWPDVHRSGFWYGRRANDLVDLLGTAIYMMSTVCAPAAVHQSFNPHTCLQKILGTLDNALQVLDKLRAICGTNVWSSLLERNEAETLGYSLNIDTICEYCFYAAGVGPASASNSSSDGFSTHKLTTLRPDMRYSTTQIFAKFSNPLLISKLNLKIMDMKRIKMPRALNIYYTKKQVKNVIELKNATNIWQKAKTVQLSTSLQSQKSVEQIIEFTVPLEAASLQFEWAEFVGFNGQPLASGAGPDSSVPQALVQLTCPRCSNLVPARPGICNHCGENVYQCVKCRTINYDERDPYLCTSCGFSKYAKWEFALHCKAVFLVEPVENEADRLKKLEQLREQSEKSDKIYHYISTVLRPQIEALFLQNGTLIPSLPGGLDEDEMLLFSNVNPLNISLPSEGAQAGTSSGSAPVSSPAIDSSTLFSSTRFGKTVHDCKQQAEEYIRLQVHMQKIRAQILYFERQLQRSQLAQLAKAKREELDDQAKSTPFMEMRLTPPAGGLSMPPTELSRLMSSESNSGTHLVAIGGLLAARSQSAHAMPGGSERLLQPQFSTQLSCRTFAASTPQPAFEGVHQPLRCICCLQALIEQCSYLLLSFASSPGALKSALLERTDLLPMLLDGVYSHLRGGHAPPKSLILTAYSLHSPTPLFCRAELRQLCCILLKDSIPVTLKFQQLVSTRLFSCLRNFTGEFEPIKESILLVPQLSTLRASLQMGDSIWDARLRAVFSLFIQSLHESTRLLSERDSDLVSSEVPRLYDRRGQSARRVLGALVLPLFRLLAVQLGSEFGALFEDRPEQLDQKGKPKVAASGEQAATKKSPAKRKSPSDDQYINSKAWIQGTSYPLMCHRQQQSAAPDSDTSIGEIKRFRHLARFWLSQTRERKLVDTHPKFKQLSQPKSLALSVECWASSLLLSPSSSPLLRDFAASLLELIGRSSHSRMRNILSLLVRLLQKVTTLKKEYGDEGLFVQYFSLLHRLLALDRWRFFAVWHIKEPRILPILKVLIKDEVDRLSSLEKSVYLHWSPHTGTLLHDLIQLLTLFAERDLLKRMYQKVLLSSVLYAYLALRRLILLRTKPLDQTQSSLLKLLEMLATGTEAETRAVMQVYVDVVRSFPPADLNSPLYIFERLCGLIVPEKKKAKETVFQISLEKDPLQEEFLQGRMQGPYRSDDHGLGPTMRDIKNKICTDCEMVALLDEDSAMELLVENRILSLDLRVAEVHKRIWLGLGKHEAREPMRIMYRMRGLLGDATEEFVQTFPSDEQTADQQNPEELYRLANVLVECEGLSVILDRLAMIEDTVTGGSAVQVILRLLGYCAKVKACRQELIKPELNSIGTLLRTLNLALASELGTLFAGGLAGPPPPLSSQVSQLPAAAVTVTAAASRAGQQQSKSATLTEQILELVSVIMSEATASLTPDKYREFAAQGGAIEQLVVLLRRVSSRSLRAHPNILQGLLRLVVFAALADDHHMQILIDFFIPLDFVRFNVQRSEEQQHRLENFVAIVSSIEKSFSGEKLKDLMINQGLLAQLFTAMKTNVPEYAIHPGPAIIDQNDWKQYLSTPSIPFVLQIMNALANGHARAQRAIAEFESGFMLHLLHRIEQLPSEEALGSHAEVLLDTLCQDTQIGATVTVMRKATRQEKKRLAQLDRTNQLKAIGLVSDEKGVLKAQSGTLQKYGLGGTGASAEEAGPVCVICREGYKLQPTKILCAYTFTKRCNVEEFELGKQYKTTGYSTVSFFNLIHLDCHHNALRASMAMASHQRARDEWEMAKLHNAQTRCNGLLPLWGAQISENAFTTALARHNGYISEVSGLRETTYREGIHDLKLLLLRFAEEKSFSEDSGGGGRLSNALLAPHLLQAALYVLNSSRGAQREEKTLRDYLAKKSPAELTQLAYDVDGPFYYATFALLLCSPEQWRATRIQHLQRLLLAMHLRAHSSNAIPKSIGPDDVAPKAYSVYKPALAFLGIINTFYEIHFKKMRALASPVVGSGQAGRQPSIASAASSTIQAGAWSTFLSEQLRRQELKTLTDCSEKLMQRYEEELLPAESLSEILDMIGIDGDALSSVFQTTTADTPTSVSPDQFLTNTLNLLLASL